VSFQGSPPPFPNDIGFYAIAFLLTLPAAFKKNIFQNISFFATRKKLCVVKKGTFYSFDFYLFVAAVWCYS
jgi:hypothetical protein